MMLGFQRNEGIKATLGLGEFDPIFKKLKDGLDAYFTGKGLWSNEAKGLPSYNIDWKHKIDRGGGNCHVISGLVDRKNLETPLQREVIEMARRHLKGVFGFHQCKMISIETYATNRKKIWEKYGFETADIDKKSLIVIKYAKLK